jgi:hypothetical protein
MLLNKLAADFLAKILSGSPLLAPEGARLRRTSVQLIPKEIITSQFYEALGIDVSNLCRYWL